MKNLLVIGSINMDIVNKVVNHPLPGETIHSLETIYSPGGKGANQAIAAHLLGQKVSMVGAVGQDAFGEQLLANFQRLGLETTYISVKEGNSGLAFITVNEQGENHIVLSEGANGKLAIQDVREILFNRSWDTVLLQNEISWDVATFVIEESARNGTKVVVNPAPARKVSDHLLSLIDLLFVNETEATYMTGIEVKASTVSKAAQWLVSRGVNEVVITLGKDGAYYLNEAGQEIFQPGFSVKAVDTTAAGDTFIGAFLAAREKSDATIEYCLRFASAAAALAVTRQGAQNSIPTHREVEAFL